MTALWPTARRWLGARLLDLRLGHDESTWLLPAIVGLGVYIGSLGGMGLLAADQSQRATEQLFASTMTLEVPAETTPARLDTVLALLKQTAGVGSVRAVSTTETARLLQPWLGPAPHLEELPVPKLIDIGTDPGRAIDLAMLRKHLASVVPGSHLDDHRQPLVDIRSAVRRIDIVFAGAIAIALTAIAAAAALATRSALRTDRSLIELAHFLGAAETAIVGPFAMRALYLALCGGAIGAATAAATIAAFGDIGRISGIMVVLPASEISDWRVWALLVAGVLATGAIAAACAGATVWRRLSLMP